MLPTLYIINICPPLKLQTQTYDIETGLRLQIDLPLLRAYSTWLSLTASHILEPNWPTPEEVGRMRLQVHI